MKYLIPGFLLLSTIAQASPIPKNENISELIEGNRKVTSLVEIERMALNSGETALDLWSGSYWPHYSGSIASRYRDPSFIPLIKAETQYSDMKKLFSAMPLMSYGNQTDNLSPAEKYDLLVGDSMMSLTKYAWQLGEKTKNGDKVATWRGLCDGWASASQMMPRPVKNVTLNSPSGGPITFFPEDIKALGTLLYAKGQSAPIFMGKRCFSKLLAFTDACDEVNAGAFHTALINRVGVMKKSFIGDISPGGEVWNYPVKNYKLTYTNVFSDEENSDFRAVLEDFSKKDKTKKFLKESDRHKSTRYIVGVKAVVNYMDMRMTNLTDADGSAPDKLLEKVYEYDLELDAQFNVLGGENPAKNLPDFMWAPQDQTYPLSIAEEQGLKLSLSGMAQTSSKAGQPLSTVIERLFEEAKEESN